MKADYFSQKNSILHTKKTIGGFYCLGKLSLWPSEPKIAFAA